MRVSEKNCYLKGGFKMLDPDNFWGSNLTVWCCAEAEHVKFSKKTRFALR